jgi:hypothetical protein
MNPWKRLLFYLFLNAIVSAVTTLAVLSIWDRTHRTEVKPVIQLVATPTRQVTGQTTAQATSAPPSSQNSGGVQVENVFGVGDLNTEVVLLKRTGDGELWVTGWRLEDENNHRFVLPELMLNKDGAIKIYTKPGTNSAIELHWGIKEAVWSSGELVSLLDQNGSVRATYRIP